MTLIYKHKWTLLTQQFRLGSVSQQFMLGSARQFFFHFCQVTSMAAGINGLNWGRMVCDASWTYLEVGAACQLGHMSLSYTFRLLHSARGQSKHCKASWGLASKSHHSPTFCWPKQITKTVLDSRSRKQNLLSMGGESHIANEHLYKQPSMLSLMHFFFFSEPRVLVPHNENWHLKKRCWILVTLENNIFTGNCKTKDNRKDT